MGIRIKLIASLSGILVVLTIILGVAFTFREQHAILELRREHLRHSAELASALIPRMSANGIESAIETLNDTTTTGPIFRLDRRDDQLAARSNSNEGSASSIEVLSQSVPFPFELDGSLQAAGQLVAEEALPDMRTALLATLRGHIALGLLLTIAAVLAVAVVCQRLVVQPIQWLVKAADSMAQGERWEAIQPESRKRDEIGVLSNHLAELSRRLSGAVRSARHSSAHLVAEGVRRDMAKPLEQLSVSLSILHAATTGENDVELEIREMGQQLRALEQLAERLLHTGVEPQM